MVTESLRRESLRAALHPEVVSRPKILNIWTEEGVTLFYRVQLSHNDSAADPRSKCTGPVSVTFTPSYRGDKASSCQSCKKPVSVSISIVKIELGLIP